MVPVKLPAVVLDEVTLKKRLDDTRCKGALPLPLPEARVRVELGSNCSAV